MNRMFGRAGATACAGCPTETIERIGTRGATASAAARTPKSLGIRAVLMMAERLARANPPRPWRPRGVRSSRCGLEGDQEPQLHLVEVEVRRGGEGRIVVVGQLEGEAGPERHVEAETEVASPFEATGLEVIEAETAVQEDVDRRPRVEGVLGVGRKGRDVGVRIGRAAVEARGAEPH